MEAILNFEQTIKMTAEWYKSYFSKSINIGDITRSQIDEYTDIIFKKDHK